MATVKITLELDKGTGDLVNVHGSGKSEALSPEATGSTFIVPHVVGISKAGIDGHICGGGKTCVVINGRHYCV
jgi:hypothetical protein